MSRATVEHVVVVVPALDEAATIAATITSIRRSIALLDRPLTSEIVVAADARSADGTPELARRALGAAGIVLAAEFGSVGDARRQATERGLDRAGCRPERTWVATTDADTIVADDWLPSQLRLADAGATAVAGVVELHDPPTDLANRFAEHYRTEADGSHAHVHGANLGMRADVYLAAGGWRDLATGEDHDLWGRVRHVAAALHTTAVRVATSARRCGRAPDGFAADLRALEASA